jgi:hypothetical protein
MEHAILKWTSRETESPNLPSANRRREIIRLRKKLRHAVGRLGVRACAPRDVSAHAPKVDARRIGRTRMALVEYLLRPADSSISSAR